MAKALIIYGSTTGNTENTAKQIGKVLTQEGHVVCIEDVGRSKIEELGNGYDLTVFGSSTWGDADIEFQEDFAPFFEQMHQVNLTGKKVALFGCSDSSYPYFCGAVDQLQEKVEGMGGIIVNEPLRIDGDPGEATSDIDSWAREIAAALYPLSPHAGDRTGARMRHKPRDVMLIPVRKAIRFKAGTSFVDAIRSGGYPSPAESTGCGLLLFHCGHDGPG